MADAAPTPDDAPAPGPGDAGAPPGRRRLLRTTLAGTALLATGALGAGAGAALTHHLDTHLSPTDRVAPAPTGPGALAARVLLQGPDDAPRACITFDDGPDPAWTPLVLDILADAGLSATFFVLGEAAAAHPELIAREAGASHEIGVHNWVHTDVYSADADRLRADVDRTIAAIESAGAPRPALWRPPYGRIDAPALAVAAERGLDLLLWSEHTPSAEHARALTTRVHAGSIILCHDGRTQPSRELLRAVGDSLVALAERGMTFLTGSQMLAASQSQ